MKNYKMVCLDKIIHVGESLKINNVTLRIIIEYKTIGGCDGYIIDMKTFERQHVIRIDSFKRCKQICFDYINSKYKVKLNDKIYKI